MINKNRPNREEARSAGGKCRLWGYAFAFLCGRMLKSKSQIKKEKKYKNYQIQTVFYSFRQSSGFRINAAISPITSSPMCRSTLYSAFALRMSSLIASTNTWFRLGYSLNSVCSRAASSV